MTLIHSNGEPWTADEMAASYAKDLRDYTSLSSAEIDARLRERYAGVMRRWDVSRALSEHSGDEA